MVGSPQMSPIGQTLAFVRSLISLRQAGIGLHLPLRLFLYGAITCFLISDVGAGTF